MQRGHHPQGVAVLLLLCVVWCAGREHMEIPIRVNVALLGFDGTGGYGLSMSAGELQEVLSLALPEHKPSSVQAREQLSVNYNLRYSVSSVKSSFLESFEKLVAANLHDLDTETSIPTDYTPGKRYIVEGNVIEKATQAAYLYSFPNAQTIHDVGVVIVNPDKARIHPEEKQINYVYQYSGTGMTQVFLTADRHVVIDIGAGPVQFGHADAGEGTVAWNSIPSAEEIFNYDLVVNKEKSEGTRRRTEYINRLKAHLTSVVVSAVRHVLLPDVRFSQARLASKVLVPIVVFRNHNEFDPLDQKDEAHRINVEALQKELKRIALPNQEITLVTGSHSLHEHTHISMAFSKALRHDSLHEVDAMGRYVPRNHPYIDSKVLMHELRESGDMLTSGLIASSPLSQVFYNQDVASHQMASDEKDGAPRSQGTMVLPVYVFSLAGVDKELLMDLSDLVAIEQDAVVVLQTNHDSVFLPYFCDGQRVERDPRNPTRHILHGLTTALGGLPSPLSRFSSVNGEIRSEYMWAVGHHPFGPFSATTSLSQIHIDAILRNTVAHLASTSQGLVEDAIGLINEFVKVYLYNPNRERIGHIEKEQRELFDVEWINRLFEASPVGLPIARSVTIRLRDDLVRLRKQFNKLGVLMQTDKYAEALRDAEILYLASGQFRQYAKTELAAAVHSSFCCSIVHEPDHPVHPGVMALLFACVTFTGGVMSFLTRRNNRRRT